MKSKISAVIVLFVLSCALASAQTFTLKSAIGEQGCTVQLQNVSGNVWLVTETCSGVTTSSIGISGGLAAKQNPAGFAIKGVIFGWTESNPVGDPYQWVVVVRTTCSDKQIGWVGFVEQDGVYLGDNYGYVSCDLPAQAAAAGERPSTLSYSEAAPRK